MAKSIIFLLTFLLLTCNAEKQAKPTELPNNSFTDSRDGKTYKTTKIGEQVLMAENLNYEAEGSVCYDNDPANCEKYGRLYNWVTAMALPDSCNNRYCSLQVDYHHRGICPSGWHITSSGDLHRLNTIVDFESRKLKATSGWNEDGNGTDEYGFSALPSGAGFEKGFYHIGERGYWWLVDEFNFFLAYIQAMHHNDKFVDQSYIHKLALISVRCVQD